MQIEPNLVLQELIWRLEACMGINHMSETLDEYRPHKLIDWV